MTAVIEGTNFTLPGQVGEPYRGKVADVYTLEHEVGTLLAVVRTDRFSAFDVKLRAVPHRGQVLNEISAELLEATRSVAPNWLRGAPDPNVSVGLGAEPIPVEVIVRGCLLGTAWRSYQAGAREICGNRLPEGMTEFQPFERPLITPTTKAHVGHDEYTTPTRIILSGAATAKEYAEMERMARALFSRGQVMAEERGLLLADTKYEFGRLATGKIVIIDEVHTPDSSRYLRLKPYWDYVGGETSEQPEQLSKEFARAWLMDQGFYGQAGQDPPPLPDAFIGQVSARYIELYELMLGRPFVPAPGSTNERLEVMQANIAQYLADLSSL